jgi:three-Cys-motif partner protein
MPKANGHVGVSAETAVKHRQVEKVLPMILRVAKQALGRWGGRLRLIDLNAGCGLYEYEGEALKGSPLIMADFVQDLTVPYEVVLVEREPAIADLLRQNLAADAGRRYAPAVRVGDNRELGPEICGKGSRRDKGLVFFDPNGPANAQDGSPLELAARLSGFEAMRSVDFLIHLNTSILKLDRCAANSARFSGKGGWVGKDVRPLDLRLGDDVKKAHWMIRRPYGGGWTLLYGTNYRFQNGWAKEGFYWTDTPEGRDLLERASYSETELRERAQLGLALDAAGGD